MKALFFPTVLSIAFILAACQTQAALPSTPAPTIPPPPTDIPTASSTPVPISSQTPLPTLFPLPVPELPIVPCTTRRPPAADLWPIVTAGFGLDPKYVPPDLVRLGDYLPGSVSLPDMLMRQAAAASLGKLVKAMRADGLKPTVLSAYRSYAEQVVAHDAWVASDPANANAVSALPGHSEHQLGTVLDFGSPEIPFMTGSTTDKFSPLFADTGEGRWLTEHADEYGFTMTNPPGAQPWTGLTFEPWHYRFVGIGLASYLKASGYFLTEYLFKVRQGLPCSP
jgi:zinc D-Ala-D-Ala carboxypeptidase